jgi:preprotein translocase subunit SecA
MLNSLLTRIFGSRNERLLRQLQKNITKINALEPELERLNDVISVNADTRRAAPAIQSRRNQLIIRIFMVMDAFNAKPITRAAVSGRH